MGKNTMGPSNSSEDTKESMEHLKVSLSHVEMVVTPYVSVSGIERLTWRSKNILRSMNLNLIPQLCLPRENKIVLW